MNQPLSFNIRPVLVVVYTAILGIVVTLDPAYPILETISLGALLTLLCLFVSPKYGVSFVVQGIMIVLGALMLYTESWWQKPLYGIAAYGLGIVLLAAIWAKYAHERIKEYHHPLSDRRVASYAEVFAFLALIPLGTPALFAAAHFINWTAGFIAMVLFVAGGFAWGSSMDPERDVVHSLHDDPSEGVAE